MLGFLMVQGTRRAGSLADRNGQAWLKSSVIPILWNTLGKVPEESSHALLPSAIFVWQTPSGPPRTLLRQGRAVHLCTWGWPSVWQPSLAFQEQTQSLGSFGHHTFRTIPCNRSVLLY